MEEILADAVILDSLVLSLLLRDKRVDKVEMSKVPDKHSVSVARKVQAIDLSEGGAELVGLVRIRRVRGTQSSVGKRDRVP